MNTELSNSIRPNPIMIDEMLMWNERTSISSIDNLHNFIFHYNSITKNWEAVNRDDYHLLFSDNGNDKVLKSKSIDTLRELIIRTNGDQDKINELLIKIIQYICIVLYFNHLKITSNEYSKKSS